MYLDNIAQNVRWPEFSNCGCNLIKAHIVTPRPSPPGQYLNKEKTLKQWNIKINFTSMHM